VSNIAFRQKYLPFLKDIGEECITSNDAYGLIDSVDELTFLKTYYSVSDSVDTIYTLLDTLAKNS